MPTLSPLFFQKLIAEMSDFERQELDYQLEQIYGNKPHAYEQIQDFALCKHQLLALLNHIVSLNPEKLQLFATYAEKVALLTETSAPPDLLITLGAAKTTLENSLPAIRSRYNQVDHASLNSFTVNLCYAGAYANLEYALTENFLDKSSLFNLVHIAKRDLVLQFAKQFLQQYQLVEHSGNEVHLANSLFNYVADSYGLALIEDQFAAPFALEQLEQFKSYLEIAMNAASLGEKIAQFLPALPATNITDMTQIKILDDFFQALGEKNPGHAQYQLLYINDEIDDIPTLIPKKGTIFLRSCIIASYLEKAGFMQGTEVIVNDTNLIFSGQHLVKREGDAYTLPTDNELAGLLDFPDIPIPMYFILQQMSTEAVLHRYLQHRQNEPTAEVLDILLVRPDLTSPMLDSLFSDLQNVPARAHQIAWYAFYNRIPFSDEQLVHLLGCFSYVELVNLLQWAIKKDNAELTWFLVAYKANLMPRETIVEGAIQFNARDILKLLGRNWDLNQMRIREIPLVHYVLRVNRLDMLATLKECGVDLNQKANGISAVHTAALKKNIPALRMLKELGANLNEKSVGGQTVASIAIDRDDMDVLIELHRLNVDLSPAEDVPLVNYAIMRERPGIIVTLETLAQLGVGMSELDQRGLTPLHLAISIERIDIIDKLHELGADFNKLNQQGLSPASFAAIRGGYKILKRFKELGVDLDAQDDSGATALYYAASGGYTQSIRTLNGLKVNVNIANNEGNTPAFIAAANGHDRALDRLVKCKANLNTLNRKGESPAFIAAVRGHFTIIELLGALGVANQPVRLSAHYASELLNAPTAVAAKAAKIREYIATNKGFVTLTPQDIAEIMGHTEIIKFFNKRNPKAGFFAAPSHENYGQNKARGKRDYNSMFPGASSSKKPKQVDDADYPAEEHQYSLDGA